MNWQSIFILVLVCVGLYFALRAIIVGRKGRCSGTRNASGGCSGCPLSDNCNKRV